MKRFIAIIRIALSITSATVSANVAYAESEGPGCGPVLCGGHYSDR
jgi:hypothetical protein